MMNVCRACLSLCLLLFSGLALAQEDELIAPSMPDEAPESILEREAISAGGCLIQNCSCCPGWFAGLGGSLNSVKLDQGFGGTASTNVFNDSVLEATGTAGGPAPPFHETLTTFAPVAQVGYFQDFTCSEWLWGAKFSYKYLGLTFSDQNINSPQTGSFTSTTDPPTTTPFTGNAIALSAQTSVNHQLALISFLGHSFRNGRFYLGGGPVVFETQTRVYDVSSYANIPDSSTDTTTLTNIGGAPLNLAGNNWMWGGAWQGGVVYYLRPSCFLDFSYDFMVTGSYTTIYPTPTTSVQGSTTYVTLINYTMVQRVWAQSLNVTFNLKF